MTDQIDYTTLPEVLAACGIFPCSHTPKPSPPTMQELWEGLCKACRDADTDNIGPLLCGMGKVQIISDTDDKPFLDIIEYRSLDYGTLNNAIGAALYWMLQQGKKEE